MDEVPDYFHTHTKNDHVCYWAAKVKDESLVGRCLSRWHPRSPTPWYSHPRVVPIPHIAPGSVQQRAEGIVCHFKMKLQKTLLLPS